MQDPVTASGNKLRAIRDLVHSNKTDPEGSSRSGLLPLVPRSDMPKPMKVTPMAVSRILLPPTFRGLNPFAITKDAIVIDYECFFAYIKAHGGGIWNVVGILNQLVSERAIPL
jgi:hypothetical protein